MLTDVEDWYKVVVTHNDIDNEIGAYGVKLIALTPELDQAAQNTRIVEYFTLVDLIYMDISFSRTILLCMVAGNRR